MSPLAIRAAFWRGGTSKAVCFLRSNLPKDESRWASIFLGALGSPDPNGRQLDGMGGGLSSLSKVIVLDRSKRKDADVDYTFFQIGVKNKSVDSSGSCGNMLAAVGPMALESGLVGPSVLTTATIRIWNTNTSKLIHSSFPARGSVPQLDGNHRLPGVSSSAAPVLLSFIAPSGSKTSYLLPDRQKPTSILSAATVDGFSGESVEVSIVDAGAPCVFVRASSLSLDGTILPSSLEKLPGALARLEQIRAAGAVLMGLSPSISAASLVPAIPKVLVVSPPSRHVLLSGEELKEEVDVVVRAISAGDPHRACPAAASLAVASAACVEGTIVWEAMQGRSRRRAEDDSTGREITLGHPSGTMSVRVRLGHTEKKGVCVMSATVVRTARKLMEGQVFVGEEEAEEGA